MPAEQQGVQRQQTRQQKQKQQQPQKHSQQRHQQQSEDENGDAARMVGRALVLPSQHQLSPRAQRSQQQQQSQGEEEQQGRQRSCKVAAGEDKQGSGAGGSKQQQRSKAQQAAAAAKAPAQRKPRRSKKQIAEDEAAAAAAAAAAEAEAAAVAAPPNKLQAIHDALDANRELQGRLRRLLASTDRAIDRNATVLLRVSAGGRARGARMYACMWLSFREADCAAWMAMQPSRRHVSSLGDPNAPATMATPLPRSSQQVRALRAKKAAPPAVATVPVSAEPSQLQAPIGTSWFWGGASGGGGGGGQLPPNPDAEELKSLYQHLPFR